MKIGIVGAGHIGSTLARAFVAHGQQVAIANSRGPQTLAELDADLGAHGHADTVQQVEKFGDVVVVAIPFGRYPEVPARELTGKVVVDTMNYYPQRDGHIPSLDTDATTSSELVQEHFAGARVVKAFNAIFWEHLRDYGHMGGSGRRVGIPVAGDDDRAKRTVMDLVEDIGFEPVDAGDLAHGRDYQPGSPVYTADLEAEHLRAHLAAAS